jgi:phage-related protein
MTIAFTGRLAITNSGSNAHVFYGVRGSKTLPKDERVRIGGDIQVIEFLWPDVKAPLVKSLGKGLWEVRVDLANRIARVFFAPAAGKMVLLHGIIKKDQRTRKQDIDKARDRLKEVLK